MRRKSLFFKKCGLCFFFLIGINFFTFGQSYVTKKTATGKAQKVFYRATQYKKNGLMEKAIKDLQVVVKIEPTFIDAHYQLASIYFSTKQLELAQTPLE
ncbi:MAG: hypothetical protein AAF960_16880, partial [Bacteroidota bacterium]